MIQNPPAEWPIGVETADERRRASEHERLKVKCAFGVAIAALITLIVSLAIGAHEWSGVQDAAAVIGPVAGVTGTIVGGYLGHQAGSAGRERDAAEHREQARVALCLAALAEPTAAAAILGIDPVANRELRATHRLDRVSAKCEDRRRSAGIRGVVDEPTGASRRSCCSRSVPG